MLQFKSLSILSPSRSCHFFGELDKFLWLYLPILVLLIINTAMFFYITYNIFKNKYGTF